jgi:hypothetical protein
VWLAREDIRPPALVFYARRIRLSLHDLFDRKAGSFQIALNALWIEEVEVHVDRTLPPIVSVQCVVSDVKAEQQKTSGLEHPGHLSKDLRQRFSGEVDDRVERGDAGQRCVGKIERQHVSLAKGNIRIEASRLFEHAEGEIQTEHMRAGVVQMAGDVAGTAAHVTNLALAFDRDGEAGQQLTIERLVFELGEDVTRVLIGDAIVARLNGIQKFSKDSLVHTGLLDTGRKAHAQMEAEEEEGRNITRAAPGGELEKLLVDRRDGDRVQIRRIVAWIAEGDGVVARVQLHGNNRAGG